MQHHRRQILSVPVAMLVCVATLSTVTPDLFGQSPEKKVRSETAARAFDFWIGQWNLTWPGGHGTNQVTFALDSAVILEQFNGGQSLPLRGMSVSVYDRKAALWKQTWVDNQGGYLDFSGTFDGRRMILQRRPSAADSSIIQRMVWANITADSLEWSWERSEDGGTSWKTLWPIHYARSH